jgi:hypothetical protein
MPPQPTSWNLLQNSWRIWVTSDFYYSNCLAGHLPIPVRNQYGFELSINTLEKITRWFVVDCVWNVMAHTQKPDFRRNGWVHLNRRGRKFSRLLEAEACASAVVMLDTPFSEVVWRVLDTHSILQFPLPSYPRVTVCHHISTGLYRTRLVSGNMSCGVSKGFVGCWLQQRYTFNSKNFINTTSILIVKLKKCGMFHGYSVDGTVSSAALPH